MQKVLHKRHGKFPFSNIYLQRWWRRLWIFWILLPKFLGPVNIYFLYHNSLFSGFYFIVTYNFLNCMQQGCWVYNIYNTHNSWREAVKKCIYCNSNGQEKSHLLMDRIRAILFERVINPFLSNVTFLYPL